MAKLQNINFYPDLLGDGPGQTQFIVSEIGPGIQGSLIFYIDGDHTKKDESEALKTAMQHVFKAIRPEQFVAEAVDEAKQSAERAEQALTELDKTNAKRIEDAKADFERSLDGKIKPLETKIVEQEQEISKLRVMISSKDMTDKQKQEMLDQYPEWQPGTKYDIGQVVRYGDQLYKVAHTHTSQEPKTPDKTATSYVKWANPTQDTATTETQVVDDWAKPANATQAYMKGDKVRFNDQIYQSVKDYNTDEPITGDWELVG